MLAHHAHQDLVLPLVGVGLLHGDLEGLLLELLRGFTVLQSPVEALAAGAVVAAGADDEHGAGSGGGLGGGQALDALVHVLIQGRAAIGGDDHVAPLLGLYPAVALQERTASLMGLDVVAGKGGDYLLVLVDDDVDDVGQLGLPGGVHHVDVQGVALQHAGAGEVGGDELGAVVAQHRHLIAHAGQHALAAAGEAGEEVGLDEALADQQLGLGRHLVDDQPSPGGQHADLHVGGRVLAVMDDNFLLRHDLFAQLVDELVLAGGAVEAGGHQQGDVDVGAALPQFGEHEGDDVLAGHRTGMVADDDGAGLFALGQLGQLGRVDGVGHGLQHQLVFALRRLQLADPGLQDLHALQAPYPGYPAGSIRDLHRIPPLDFSHCRSCAAATPGRREEGPLPARILPGGGRKAESGVVNDSVLLTISHSGARG